LASVEGLHFGSIGEEVFEKEEFQSDYFKVWRACMQSIRLGIQVTVGDRGFSWNNGLPSGWRWTALLDTILNISSFRVAKKIVEEILHETVELKGHCSQGDIIFCCRDYEQIRMLISVYVQLGYEMHPQKTYISN
jgi:hypothetical protein